MLSKKTKYALKALMVLAKEYGQGPVLISDIAQREEIPQKFLERSCSNSRTREFCRAGGAKAADIFWGERPIR